MKEWQPATASERYQYIDIIRGLALFGVLMVNMMSDFRVPLLEYILRRHMETGRADYMVDLLVSFGLEFKAIAIFSFLFGVGIAIQFERAAARKVNPEGFLLQRMLWLFVIGVTHLFLIWNGDILALYAVCGLLLIPCLHLRWPWLLALGAVAVVFPEFVSFGGSIPSGAEAALDIARAREIYGNAGFIPILKFRWQETWSLIMPLLTMILSRTAGLMFWGMAAWRSGIVRAPARHRGTLVAGIVIGAILGTAITINGLIDTPWHPLKSADFAGSLLLALAYVSGLLLWLHPQRSVRLPGLAAMGQMALTNYLMQSIVLGIIFYGYGFGRFGRMGSAATAFIGLLLYAVQVQVSRLWLRHFQFGPVEWLWRSLAYQQRQAMARPIAR